MKKKNLVLLVAILCSIAIYSFISKENISVKNSLPLPSDSIPDNSTNSPQKFILGIMDSEYDFMNNGNYSFLTSLKFNTWHRYTGGQEISPTLHYPQTDLVPNDYVENTDQLHADQLKQKMDDISGSSDMFLLMQRPKIEWLIYGQRSDYQCEAIPEDGNPAHDNWFYSFQEKLTGHDVNDTKDGQPIKAVYCRTANSNNNNSEAIDNPGYVVRRLKANSEQCNLQSDGNQWQGDMESKWYIKPSIKVDAAWVYAHSSEKVCKIKVIDDNSNTILEKDILGENFYDADLGIIYTGQYIEEFTRGLDLTTPTGAWATRDNAWGFKSRGDKTLQEEISWNRCHADIQVFWYGNCDMWIDYVRVDNETAHKLFNPTQFPTYQQWIEQEADILTHQTNGKKHVIAAYSELISYNNIPCIEYVNKKLLSLTGNSIGFMCDVTSTYGAHLDWDKLDLVMNAGHIYRNLIQKCQFQRFFCESYPFTGQYGNIAPYSKIPTTLQTTPNHYIMANPVPPEEYDNWLQENLEAPYWFDPGQPLTTNDSPFKVEPLYQDAGNFKFWMKTAREISRLSNKPFIFMPQLHQWYRPGEVRREPTNEEQDLLANLGVGYGAKGLIYFYYPSYDNPPSANNPDGDYGYGIQDKYPNYNHLREHNFYGQAYPKWQKIKDINERMLKWEPYLMSFQNSDIKTYIYNKEATPMFDEGKLGFFYDIKTYKPVDNSVDVIPINHETSPEPLSQRYLQITFFNDPTISSEANNEKFFMITNKRCSPYAPLQNSVGGPRFIKAKIDVRAQSLIGMNDFQNFNIVDIATNEIKATFYKNGYNSNIYQEVELGWLNPGEGKIFKIAPVLKTGGTLIADEIVQAPSEFQCTGIVYNNGKQLMIPGGTKVRFGVNAGIEMTGGNLWVGYDGGNGPIELTGINGNTWKGIKINGSVEASYLLNTTIANVAAKYMISVSNCPQFAMDRCTLNGTNGFSGGGVQLNYSTSFGFNPIVEIDNSYFNIYSNDFAALKIMAFAGEAASVGLRYNHISNNLNPGGGIGVLLNNLGGSMTQNQIYNFGQGVSTSSSSIDLFNNTILTTIDYVDGIAGAPSCLFGINSVFNLAPSNNSFTGGNNNLSVKQGNCIWLDASYFNMAKGNNYLNIVQSDWRHLYGYFPFVSDSRENATGNCFKINGRDPIVDADVKRYVIYADATPVDFDFLNFNCTPFDADNFYVIDGGISNDTIWTDGSGSGGGQNSVLHTEDFSFKALYDSLNINMRKKQYELAETKCKMLLEQYPDSGKTIDAVGKLYMSTIARNNSGNRIEPLKSYYEAYIQNHANNTMLVKRIFYFIQKCKVKLNQYASAMQGFQTIMTQFPTTYDGLIAKWDYTATHLLDSISGSGGGEQSAIDFDQLSIEEQHNKLINLVEDPNDKYDKKKFTKEDRKVIVQNIVNSFETEKSKEVKKVKTLEQKVNNNEATKMEKSEYKSKTLLKTVVKPQIAKTMDEHIDIVQNDLEKVFSLKESHSVTTDNIPIIAYDYKLNQNYPNPFNPTTKINYELKNAGFVSLKIYDLLGREIAELVNETKDAGRYTIDFNASRYKMASGIYFYRIKAGEFVDTKRMVLIK